MLLYPKNSVGRAYTRLLTSTPIVFILFIWTGAVLFLFITLTTKIDVIRTYQAEIIKIEGELLALSIKADGITAGSAYLYSNKNEAVYPIFIERTERSNDKMVLYMDINDQKVLRAIQSKDIFVDVPQGKESLLYRIVIKGGKGIE